MIQEMYRLTIIGIIKAKVIYRIEKYIIYIDILVWGGILNIEMRGDSVMRKKRLCEYPSEGLNYNSDINNVRMWIILFLY